MVAAAGAVHPHASAQSDHQSPPRPSPPHLISHLSRDNIFSMKFSRYHFFDKILEISLVFTHGITPAWVNHNRCFVKKCILMFRAMHGHLASTKKYQREMRSRETEFCVCERERYFTTRVIARETYQGTRDISRERQCV